MRRLVVILITASASVTACGSTRTSEPATSAAGAASPLAADDRPDAGTDGVTLGACRLPAPVVSGDACASDADCAPATPCHARACVGKAHAAPRPANAACTMMMDCASIDANACACFQGRCALVPRG